MKKIIIITDTNFKTFALQYSNILRAKARFSLAHIVILLSA